MGKKRIIKQTQEQVLKETELNEKSGQIKKGKYVLFDRGRGAIYIQATYNNTIITITDSKGEVRAWSSAGAVGFKGPKKSTPFAASKIIDTLFEKIKNSGLREVAVYIKGVGSGREAALRSLVNHGLEISVIKDLTSIPHNGCRPKKPRRV